VKTLCFCAALGVLSLSACGGTVAVPDDPAVQGLAAEKAGLDAEGNPIQTTAQQAAEPAPGQRRGLFGLFGAAPEPARETAPAPAASETASDTTADSPIETGSAAPPAEATPETTIADADPPRRGLFALFGGGRADDPGAQPRTPFGAANAAPAPRSQVGEGEVAKGTLPPFGQVATVCGLSARDLGKPVARAPRDGRARWQLHDPDPSSTGQRTQYVTGFRDRCARQITGALVLFGRADVHETTRYAHTNTRPYTATDDAYEDVKSRICGVRARVPCPADRYDRLDAAVSFVTVYARFGATDEWYELLLVEGQLRAAAMSGF